jgi:protocatechuate 3,4-dioxygenase beta subunit
VAVTCAAAPALTGRVYTQGKVEKVVARLWALGDSVVSDPAKAGRPLAETALPAGQAFTFDLENVRLPVRVELAAGHVGLAFDVLFPSSSPPAWLPEGTSLAVSVSEDGKPAAGALVWGRLPEFRGLEEPGRWRTCVPRSQTGADGRVTVWVRTNRTLKLWAVRRDRWGSFDDLLGSRGELVLRLVSKQVAVRLVDRRGEPVSGARVAVTEAPPGFLAVTAEDGRAAVPAIVDKEWTIVALGSGLVARSVLHGPPKEVVELAAEPPEELEVQWSGVQEAVAVEAPWIPAALRGDAPLVASSPVRLPFLGPGGIVQLWRPGVAPSQLSVAGASPTLVVRLERCAAVTGRVVEEDGKAAAGVPVWVWGIPAWQRRGGRIVVRGSSRAILERAALPWNVTDDSGGFSLPDLVPGPVKVSAWRAGQPEVESDDLRLAAGASQLVTLTLENGTWLALTATDPEGRRLAGVAVEVRPDREPAAGRGMFRLIGPGDEDTQTAATGSTDREGRVTVRGVPRGPISTVLRLAGFVPRTVEAEVPAEGVDLGVQVLEPGVAVQGRVVDERGQGVADAAVFSDPWGMGFFGEGGTRSDAQGFFVLADQPRSGELFLSARGEGFASATAQLVKLPPQGLVELKVRRTRSLDGRVLARESGEPVAGARVGANRRVERGVGGAMGMSSAMQIADAESSDDGRFRLDGLPPLELTVNVGAEGFRPRSLEVDLSRQDAPRELTVIIERGLTIRGTVIDAGGAPYAGADVEAMPAEGAGRVMFSSPDAVRTGADGRFEITGVSPGRWQVTAEAEGGLRAQEVVEAGTGEIELRLEGGGTIRGRVTTPGGTVPTDVRVSAWGSGGWNGEQALSGNGSFEFADVPAGTARISAGAGAWRLVEGRPDHGQRGRRGGAHARGRWGGTRAGQGAVAGAARAQQREGRRCRHLAVSRRQLHA